MRRSLPLVLFLFALIVSPRSVGAQTTQEPAAQAAQTVVDDSATGLSQFNIHVGPGLTLPIFGTRGEIGPGWNVEVGGTFWLWAGSFGVRGDYLYNRFGSEERTFQAVVDTPGIPGQSLTISAKAQAHVYTASGSWRHQLPGGETLWLFAGPAIVHRRVAMTGQGAGLVAVCNPVWLQCSAGPVTFDRAIGIRHTTDWGMTFGGGTSFDLGLSAKLFTELRYLRAGGPEFTDTAGKSREEGVHLLKATIGLRF
jgi:opacity protein-like surface antigen